MAWPDFAYDHYENAEDATLDGWAETDPDGVLTLADATLPYNGSGSHSCVIDTLNSDTYLEGIHTAAAASIGFWFYTGTWNNGDSIQWFRLSNDGYGTLLRLKLSNNAGVYTIADIDSADSVTVAAATWKLRDDKQMGFYLGGAIGYPFPAGEIVALYKFRKWGLFGSGGYYGKAPAINVGVMVKTK